jgi:hypothetical protein
VIEDVMRSTPAPASAGTAAEARSVMAFAVARGLLTPANKVPRQR